MKVRIWCEFLKPQDVCRDFVVDILKKYNICLNYKLEYMDFSDNLLNMIKLYNENNIPISIWATLNDEMGYWINETNVDNFGDYVHNLCNYMENNHVKIDGLCIDMEPPFHLVQKLYNPKSVFDKFMFYTTLATKNLNMKRYIYASKKFSGIAEYLRNKGIETYAPVTRETYYDVRLNTDFIQNALQTPVFHIPWDSYNLMYYGTVMRKTMKGFGREDIDYLIYRQVKYMAEKFPKRISVSVGLANVGKLGNEPYYDNMEDFSRDVGIIKACGVHDISIFSLDGLMDAKRLESFIECALDAEPFVPDISKKVIDEENKNKRLMNIAKAYYKPFKIGMSKSENSH